MTVPVNDRRIQYVATAAQTIFPYDFRIEEDTAITILQTIKLTGVTNTLVLTTDYTVSNVAVDGGGNITLVSGAAIDDIITITGATPLSRVTDFNDAGDFLASDLNSQLDSQIRILQENELETSRALLLAPEDTATSLTLPVTSERISKFLAFDSNGDPIPATTITTAVVSPFAETYLDDLTAEDTRATLGAAQKSSELDTITSMDDTDKFVITDTSDSDNSKTIEAFNLQNTTTKRGLSLLPDQINITSNPSDTDHDITFSAGVMSISGGDGQAVASSLIKQLDATWVAGTNAGGLADALTVANDTYYYCHALSNADGTTVDFGFDTSSSAANLLADTNVIAAGLTKFSRVGGIKTDGSANINNNIVHQVTPFGQVSRFTTGSLITGTTIIPLDDTEPQSTEGFEVMDLEHSALKSSSKLIIEVSANVASSSAQNSTIALFRDAESSSIASGATGRDASNVTFQPQVVYHGTPGTTSLTTYKVRVGNAGSGTLSFNGRLGVRLFGGVMASSITITEY